MFDFAVVVQLFVVLSEKTLGSEQLERLLWLGRIVSLVGATGWIGNVIGGRIESRVGADIMTTMSNVGVGTAVSVDGSLGTGCFFFAVLLPFLDLTSDLLPIVSA